MNYKVTATEIGVDNRGNRTRKPSPSQPIDDRQAVDRYQERRYAAIDAYFAAVRRDEDAMVIESSDDVRELLKVALSEERGQ